MKHLAFAAAVCLVAGAAFAEEKLPEAHGAAHTGHAAAPSCAEPLPKCAATATPSFGKDGRLWLAYGVGETVYGAVSTDNGQSFSPPFRIASTQGATLDANGEARPKLLALADGTLLASFTTRPQMSYDGTIFIARSTDGGESFSKPAPLIEGAGQRFETFVPGRNGRLYVAWLDKTNAEKAKAKGEAFAGGGVAVAWSDDGGKTFAGKRILLDHSCECCRLMGARDRDGRPVFVWRHVFDGNLRDHMAAKLSPDGSALEGLRVSEDEWATSCPHHGPALAIDNGGAWHVAWFTNGKRRKGLFYARSLDGGKSFGEAEKFGDDARAPSRPFLLASGSYLYRAWKEFDGTATAVMVQASRDRGKSWGAARAVAATAQSSDHPLLVASKGKAYLSWLTREEGYRLIPLEGAKMARWGG